MDGPGRDYEAQIRNYRGPEPLEPWDGCLQWAEECLPLQEKQSCWPGLLEELVKVFVGDKSTQTQQRESWRRWKTLSLCRWNSWVMESSRSSKNRAGSRLQPGSPVTRAIQVHPPQWGEREHVWTWRISGRALEKKEGSSFTDLCHNPSCRSLLFGPGGFVLLDST